MEGVSKGKVKVKDSGMTLKTMMTRKSRKNWRNRNAHGTRVSNVSRVALIGKKGFQELGGSSEDALGYN